MVKAESDRVGTISHDGDKAYLPGRSATSAHFTLLAPELGQLANDG